MKIGILLFPGTSGESDIEHVIEEVFGLKTEKIWHKETSLNGYSEGDIIFIPGGSSFGDHLRPGAIAQLSPIMKPIKAFAEAGGILIGICNGFQILCESGLLDGVLLKNRKGKYISKNIYLKIENGDSILTRGIEKGRILKIPIAHGDGRYYADEATLNALESNNQILFRYCDVHGVQSEIADVNGSTNNIASISNREGNVIGILPHPERAAEEILGNTDGRLIFESILAEKLTGV